MILKKFLLLTLLFGCKTGSDQETAEVANVNNVTDIKMPTLFETQHVENNLEKFREILKLTYKDFNVETIHKTFTITTPVINKWIEESSADLWKSGTFHNTVILLTNEISAGYSTYKIKQQCDRYFSYYRKELSQIKYDFSQLPLTRDNQARTSWEPFYITAFDSKKGQNVKIESYVDLRIAKYSGSDNLASHGVKWSIEYDTINCDHERRND